MVPDPAIPAPYDKARPLPIDIPEITLDWLTTALRMYAPDVSVRHFEIVDVINGTSTKLRIRLEMDEAGQRAGIPRTVILKGGFEPHSREYAFMHESEVRGYRDVYSVLELETPICYFADFDAERKQGIVIMEDLVASGVAFCHPLRPHTYDEVALRLNVLAKFHASTWASSCFARGGQWDWVRDTARTARDFKASYILKPEFWNNVIALPRGAAASVRFHDPDWMARVMIKQVIFSDERPQSILHGDTHLGNLYVTTDGIPGFFDSLVGRAPPMSEIAYHVAGGLDPSNRRQWEGALVGHYLDELRRHGIDAPSFDDAMHQYAMFLARGYLIFLVNDTHYQSEAINTAYTARFSAAMLDHGTFSLYDD